MLDPSDDHQVFQAKIILYINKLLDRAWNGRKYKVQELSEINIERIKHEFKTHHNAIDFDEKFVYHCFSKITKNH